MGKFLSKELLNKGTSFHNTINESKIEVLPKNNARVAIEKKYPILKGKKIILDRRGSYQLYFPAF